MVQKKRTSHHFFHLKTAGTVGIWQRHGRSPTWTFYRLYGIHARCVYTPPLIDFCRCFICFQTITCRPVKASSILFGSNLQTQTCQEQNVIAGCVCSRVFFKLYFILLHPVVPQKLSGSWSSSLLVNVGILMSVCKTESINLHTKKVKYQSNKVKVKLQEKISRKSAKTMQKRHDWERS
jgi:hypothetical protein